MVKDTLELSILDDIRKITGDVKKYRRIYYIILPIAFVLGFVYNKALPNYFTCSVKIAPEIRTGKTSSLMYALAYDMGVTITTNKQGDAIYPELYPTIFKTKDFRVGLLSVMIKPDFAEKEISYYDYLLNYQKRPFWSEMFGRKKRKLSDINLFRLTDDQNDLVDIIKKKVECKYNIEECKFVITVTDQDPDICAVLADSVKTHLQQYITDYEVSKARIDYEYYIKMTEQSKLRYQTALRLYSEYCDANQDALSEKILSRRQQLEDEMNMQLQTYNYMLSNKLQAEADLQNTKPAFMTLQSATVPLLKAGPSKAVGAIKFFLFVVVCITAFVMYKEKDFGLILGFK